MPTNQLTKQTNRKKDDRLDWMYAGQAAAASADREEFLLGKTVTDSVLGKQAPEHNISAVRVPFRVSCFCYKRFF